MCYADDILLTANSDTDMALQVQTLAEAIEERGLAINIQKSAVLEMSPRKKRRDTPNMAV